MVAERDIRSELKKRVEAYGGKIRAVKWIGRRSAPDVLCLFPEVPYDVPSFMQLTESHPWVETKAPNGKPTDAQAREHERMRKAGCIVLVVSTTDQLDSWLPPL